MPLIIAPLNTELTIVKVLADEKTKKHLESLGVTVNGKISVISCSSGNCIVVVKGVRIGFDRNLATKIVVA